MIITRLSAGLGNQMFQYACGRALALRNGDNFKMDITAYANQDPRYPIRAYSLSVFNIIENIATREEIEAIHPHDLISKLTDAFRKKILRQSNVNFNPAIFSKKGGAYLDGFWQTEKYFADYAADIRKDFTLKKPLSPAAQKIADQITSSSLPTVLLNVRRGDYVTNAAISAYHGISSPEYYSKALKIMSERLGQFQIFVVSDDIDWVKEHINMTDASIKNVTYISKPAGTPREIADYEEIILMSMCKHNIIPNSSFGWWGAWLNQNPDKIVIAPENWSLKNKKQHADTVPPAWIRL